MTGALSLMLLKADLIVPSGEWLDQLGKHVQAHGGGMIKLGRTYYWFGEDRSEDNVPDRRYVACYSSTDLTHWKFHRQVVDTANPEGVPGYWVLERPKVFYNKKTRKFVMYMHYDDGRYRLARVGVAVADKVDGDYKLIKTFRPLNTESRDIGQFIDDDGTAYLIWEDRANHGFHIGKLSPDYMDVAEETTFIKAPLEGGAVVHYGDKYYAIGSWLTGWDPNPNVFACAPSLKGPWTEFKDIAPPATKTYHSQSTMMLKVSGTKKTTVVFMADQWKPKAQHDSRYLWMPLEIGDGKLWLPEPKPWKIDVKTGEVSYIK